MKNADAGSTSEESTPEYAQSVEEYSLESNKKSPHLIQLNQEINDQVLDLKHSKYQTELLASKLQ